MMRFIVDCLRPARTRAAAAQSDSVELQAQVKDSSDNIEIKELKDAVQMEEETLQRVKTLRCETQEAVERQEERKSQLRDQLKIMENLEKQEREVLQSLQEEQQELEQTIQQYDVKLRAVSDSVLQLQMEVDCAKAHSENIHVRIAPLQDSFDEILQVKKKLDELIAGFMTDERSVTEIPEKATCENVENDFDRNHQEEIRSEQEVEEVKLERSVDTQCSADNLKSSGSSSFTEITLTEVKEEDVMFRSATSQLESFDMEEEDFEMVQHSQTTNRQFDFFRPNPFTDGDVFGDDHFPKADVTERLPRDPFKGTDPFASDTLFVDISEVKGCQDSFITAEQSLPETVHCPLQSVGKDRDYGTFNTSVNLPLDAQSRCSTERLVRHVSVPTESKSLRSRSNTCPEVGTNTSPGQTLDAVQANQSVEAVSPPLDEDHVYSHSSSEFDSFEADCSTFGAVEEEDDRVQPGSLCGLQKIIAGSYTDFPLSPCDPDTHPDIRDTDKTFGCPYMITVEKSADCCHSELENGEKELNNPGGSHDIKSETSAHCSALEAYDYKYGDMFFFTVRLDPGSPELHNPDLVCPEYDDVKKCGSLNQMSWNENSLSPEFNDTDEFKCCAPKPENTNQVETEIATDSLCANDSESCGDSHIPRLTLDDSNACESLLNSEANDPNVAIHILDSSVQDTECGSPLKSIIQDFFASADQHCAHENLESSHSPQLDSHCCERLTVSKSELQYFDPFSPISTESADCVSEFEEMYTINCHDASRLDSGYHEVDTPTAVHQDPVDTSRYSFALRDPCLETSKESNWEFHNADPFSPKSIDTGIFDSEIENYESDYVTSYCQSFSPQKVYIDLSNSDEKVMSFFNTVSCDVLSDHHSGSESDDCYTFGPFPHKRGNSNDESNAKNVRPELSRDKSPACGETKPILMASNAYSNSVWKTSEPNPEMCITTAVDSSVSKQAEDVTNHTVNVSKVSDLADIDYFCSELSKMVSSCSSDSVQQSVTEMLFGSDPNTSSFYPWDFEKQQHNS
ncbi:uncharacterized protein si:ch73-140j24.4 [Triplophysa rosa]|uniref:Epidermal growth factor receptor substrate 15 n=1 Tax=Triplophysa rosa TaxID=992332 RepID=A0A9W7WX03_TRIRA|nr:uncharacterized protein si:ch73-140j24.4 [Triplophysa rosa]KAI7810212.1 hypothetical protein IRJ41_023682 [Triplophysa rosa]